MSKLKALLVDDELAARENLQFLLSEYCEVEVQHAAPSAMDALTFLSSVTPDVIFLDIQMPEMNGIEFANKIKSRNIPIVFITAFDQFAIRAFKASAVDYVLKPIEDSRLEVAIERVRTQLHQSDATNQKQRLIDLITNITGKRLSQIDQMLENGGDLKSTYPEKLAIKDAGKTTLIPVADITWVEAAGDYMCIHSNNPKQVNVLRSTMKELEAKLNPSLFQRVHRSTIVNIDCIQKICSHINGEYFLILDDEAKIKMSRSYRSKIKHII